MYNEVRTKQVCELIHADMFPEVLADGLHSNAGNWKRRPWITAQKVLSVVYIAVIVTEHINVK